MTERCDIEFDGIEQALKQVNALTGPSETHGIVCGVICAGQRMNGRTWLETVMGAMDIQNSALKEQRGVLFSLYQQSSEQLQDFSFGFSVLLPDDETDLGMRAQALSDWCRGFLSGLGLAGINMDNGQLQECEEALQDFSEIAKLEHAGLSATNNDEESYMHIVEYVRMAVLLVYTVLTAKQNRQISMGEGELLH